MQSIDQVWRDEIAAHEAAQQAERNLRSYVSAMFHAARRARFAALPFASRCRAIALGYRP